MAISFNNGTRRFGVAIGALAVAAFLAGCGGDGDGDAGGGGGGGTPADARLSPAQAGDIVAYFKSKITQRSGLGLVGTAITNPTVGVATQSGSIVSYSGKLTQDTAVEEDDLLKTDGNMVYAAHRSYTDDNGFQAPRLSALSRLADGGLKSIANVTLDPAFTLNGLYLANNASRIAVLSQQDPYYGRQTATPGAALVPEISRKFSFDFFSAATNVAPAQLNRIRIDGLLVGSRMIGNTLYVVSTFSPDLTRFSVPPNAAASTIATTIQALDNASLLPTVQVDTGAAQPLVAEGDCLVQGANASIALQVTTVTAIDLASSNLARSSKCFVGGNEALYLAAGNIYLASSRQYRYGTDIRTTVFPADSQTDLHKFALSAMQIDYRGSGSANGHLGWDPKQMPGRMDEYQGNLRVLTFTAANGQSSPSPITIQATGPASPALLTVLGENATDHKLAAVATLPNTQRSTSLVRASEQVNAVLFAGPRAYLSTYTKTEPVYALDLSAAADPKPAGEIAVAAAYADHLIAMPNGLLLGIGDDTNAGGAGDGVRVALFDVTNPAQARLLGTQTVGAKGSRTALESSRKALSVTQTGQRVRIGLPSRVYATQSGGGTTAPSYQGLLRFEIDTAVGALSPLVTLKSTTFDADDGPGYFARFDLAKERAFQIGTPVYYASGGKTYYLLGF